MSPTKSTPSARGRHQSKHPRTESRALLLALKDGGSTTLEAAKALGISHSYAYALINDPDGSRDKARKTSYRGTCTKCGSSTTGSDGRNAPTLCCHCAPAEQAIWSREIIIEHIREFVRLYDMTPGAQDWNPSMARGNGRHDLSERFYADGCWPHSTTVVSTFGTWNAAIAAAGYTPRRPGHKRADCPNVVPTLAPAPRERLANFTRGEA